MAFLFEDTKKIYTYREAGSGLIKTTEVLVNDDKVTNVELELY